MPRRTWPINLLLAAGITWFGWQGWLVWSGDPLPVVPGTDASPPAKPEGASMPEPPAVPARDEFKVIEELNLFAPNRAPAPPPPKAAAEVKAPAPPPENLQERYLLYGVIRTPEGRYKAIVRDKKTPNAKAQTYLVGDALAAGHTLKEVDDKKAVVASAAGAQAEIMLRAPKGADDTGYVPKPIIATGVPQPPGKATPTPTPPPAAPAPPGISRPAQPPQPGRAQPPRGPNVGRPRSAPIEEDEDDEDWDEDDEEWDEEDDEDWEEDEEEW